MNEEHTITIKLKSYTRQYLINVCGYPVNLYNRKNDNDLLNKIIDCLKKPKRDREKECSMKGYIETRFVISKRDFFRAGCIMTKTDMVLINKRVENLIKKTSRELIFTLTGVGMPTNEAIRRFQEKLSLPEDVMSYDLIYKDYLRHRKHLQPDPIVEKINEKIKEVEKDINEIRKSVTEMATGRHFG